MLEQSLRVWHHHIDSFFINDDFFYNQVDKSFYVKQMFEYFFGGIPLCGQFDHISKQCNPIEFKKEFEINDIGEVHYCLGVKFERNREVCIITTNQKN